MTCSDYVLKTTFAISVTALEAVLEETSKVLEPRVATLQKE